MDDNSQNTRAPRFSVPNLNVIYDADGSYWSGPVVDMSESGVFVETSHELSIGVRVTLVPDVPEDEALPFEIEAEVVRVNRYEPDAYTEKRPGIAFRIHGLSDEQFGTLGKFLRDRGVPVSGATLFGGTPSAD
ncbi:MAG: PilZ domain-containing protein [Myxococcota bacterium]